MAFQTLTIDLNANLQKLQSDLDSAQKLSADASARIQQSANDAGTAIGNAANEGDFSGLSKDAKAAASSIDDITTASAGAGTAVGGLSAQVKQLLDQLQKDAAERADQVGVGTKIATAAVVAGIGYGLVKLGEFAAAAAFRFVSASVDAAAALYQFSTNVDAYKSKNIDALDEIDKRVRSLQADLVTTAEAASALDLAFRQTGVPKDDYTAVYNSTADAIRKAIDEQEKLNKAVADARQTDDGDKLKAAETAVEQYSNAFKDLGIQYQDAKGKALDTTTVIANSAKALGDYAQGYDRNAAAAALGIGKYTQVVNAAKINDDALEVSQSRLKAYFLIVGPVTQAALNDYHKAVDGFATESDLMSKGFKAAIADSVLPQLAGLAEFFKDGLPSTVGLFREALTAAVAALEFFKAGVYAIAQPVIATFEAIGIGAAAGMLAVQKALHFDFSGALKELDDGRKAILDRFSQLPDEIGARVAIAEKNINLARGSDSLDANAKLGDRPVDLGAGRIFTGLRKPPDEDKSKAGATPNVDVAKKLLDKQLKDLDVFIAQEKEQLTGRDEFLQAYYDHGDVSIRDYFAFRKTAQDEYLASARKGYAEEIADLNAYIQKTQANSALSPDQSSARVLEAQTKLIDVREKLRKVEADASTETIKDWFANRKAVEAYQDDLRALEAQIKSSTGDTAGAFAISFDDQNRERQRKLQAVLNSDSSTQPERNAARQGQLDLAQLREQGVAAAQLNDLTSQRTVVLDQLGNVQARINIAVASGTKTELEGLAATSEANKARIADLQKIIDAQQAIAQTIVDPFARSQALVSVDKMRVELEQLKSQTDLVADKFRSLGESVTESFFEKLLSGTVTLKSAFKSLVADIITQLAKMQAAAAAQQLFAKDGVLGSTISSAVNGGNGSGASILGSALQKLFGSFGSSNSAAGSPGAAYIASAKLDAGTPSGGFHEGGIVGGTPTFSRVVDMAVFKNARRFHSGGIADDEVPIIAQKGEGVFTRAQMARMSPVGGATYLTTINNTISDARSRQSQGQITNQYARALDQRRRTRSA